MSLLDPVKWPTPDYVMDDEPHFLFIITPPYSGSTAIARLLNTSHRTMVLEERCEGQLIVPGLRDKARWDQDMVVNYESIRAVWLNKYQSTNKLVQNIDTVIEKSPPNMMRIEQLVTIFKSCSVVANNRNPYANCASILYRNYDALNIDSNKRKVILEAIAQKWLKRSYRIRELVQRLKISLVTYESFCKDPALLIQELQLPVGVTESINLNARVQVKDYKPQKIINQNNRQINRLNRDEMMLLSNIFSAHQDLLFFYDYAIV
jgi:hypothetical protein